MDILRKWILVIGIVVCGVCLMPTSYDSALEFRHFLWCGLTIALVLCTKEFKLGTVHIFLIGYLVCSLYSGIFAINKSEWLYWVLRIFLMIIFLSVIKIDRKLLAKTMILLGVVFIGYFWYEYIQKGSFVRCRGLAAQRNYWSAMQFFIIPFCYYAFDRGFWKKLSIFVAICMVVNIFLMGSRSVVLAVFVSSFVLGIINKKSRAYVLGFCVLGVVVMCIFKGKFLHTQSLHLRFEQWKYTLIMIAENPFGVGVGNWLVMFPKYAAGIDFGGAFYKESFRFPHNDFLWVFAEAGIGGGICYIGVFATAVYRALKNKSTYLIIALSGYITIACFTSLRERAFPTLILMTFIALSCSRSYKISQPKVILTLLVFTMVVFGFRVNSSCWNKKLKIDYRNIDYSTRGYSVFSTLVYNGTPWKFFEGVLNFKLRYTGIAQKQLDVSYRHNPYSIFALNGKGLSCVSKGDRVSARKYFQDALDICPDFIEARENLERANK